MIDTLKRFVRLSDRSDVIKRLGIARRYALLTLHRPANVDDETVLRRIHAALLAIGREVPVIFPAHPRTAKRMEAFGLRAGAGGPGGAGGAADNGVRVTAPLGYIDFLHLQKRAALILTDSGGIQEEATILGVPCLTLRDNTERPITVTHGTNRLVGRDTEVIVAAARHVLRAPPPRRPPRIPLWDGRAAERIAAVFARLPR